MAFMLGQYLAPGERGTLHRRKDLSCGFVFRFGLNKVFKLEFGSKVYLVISYVNTFVCMSVTREEVREGEEMQFSSVHI